jgi:hypothetical protein
MSSYPVYAAVRHALMGQTTKGGQFVSIWDIALVVEEHLGDKVPLSSIADSLWSMHEYGMATVNGSGRGMSARYDGILVFLNRHRKVAVVTDHGYAIADWAYLLNPEHNWKAEVIPAWSHATE